MLLKGALMARDPGLAMGIEGQINAGKGPANAVTAAVEEIAGIMECPIGTVRSRIFRAREAIAERLRPLLDTAPDKRW